MFLFLMFYRRSTLSMALKTRGVQMIQGMLAA